MIAAATQFPLIVTEIAGQPVAALAQKFGTPLFVYDAAIVAERVADLAVFDVVRYAQKASSNLAILDVVRRAGACVDAVISPARSNVRAARFRPGFNEPPYIVYTADIFDREALEPGPPSTRSRSIWLA